MNVRSRDELADAVESDLSHNTATTRWVLYLTPAEMLAVQANCRDFSWCQKFRDRVWTRLSIHPPEAIELIVRLVL